MSKRKDRGSSLSSAEVDYVRQLLRDDFPEPLDPEDAKLLLHFRYAQFQRDLKRMEEGFAKQVNAAYEAFCARPDVQRYTAALHRTVQDSAQAAKMTNGRLLDIPVTKTGHMNSSKRNNYKKAVS